MPETIRFRTDTATRRRLMDAESFAHPAKGHMGMWAEMIQRYSQPGDLVLDPMAGSGATLTAALMGRNVVCVELEAHFVEPMRRSWAKMRTMPMLGYEVGSVAIIRGDARCLPLRSADVILTSPPFHDTGNAVAHKAPDGHDAGVTAMFRRGLGWKQGQSYTRPQVDAVITSPPFQDAIHPTTTSEEHWADPQRRGASPYIQARFTDGYARNTENIGNMRGDRYWGSSGMAAVYAECWRVLRPGGLMALVLKGFTRDGKYVDLPGQTEALLLAAGWAKHDEWRRELWSLSFWRILQRRRDPAAFDERLMFETVLAFRKPGDMGPGVDTILTSPPYEGQLAEGRDGIDWQNMADGRPDKGIRVTDRYRGYTRSVDLVVTSPPYESSPVAQSSDAEANRRWKAGEPMGDMVKGMGLQKGYTRDATA